MPVYKQAHQHKQLTKSMLMYKQAHWHSTMKSVLVYKEAHWYSTDEVCWCKDKLADTRHRQSLCWCTNHLTDTRNWQSLRWCTNHLTDTRNWQSLCWCTNHLIGTRNWQSQFNRLGNYLRFCLSFLLLLFCHFCFCLLLFSVWNSVYSNSRIQSSVKIPHYLHPCKYHTNHLHSFTQSTHCSVQSYPISQTQHNAFGTEHSHKNKRLATFRLKKQQN